MSTRNRWRQPATPEYNIRDTLPIPYVLPWVSGRYYSCVTTSGSIPGGIGLSKPYLQLIYVPQSITIVSIGVEVVTAGSAGLKCRLALYTHNPDRGLPDRRVIDSGGLPGDATGFQSATVNRAVSAGWHWMGFTANSGTFYRGGGSVNWRYAHDAWGGQVNVVPDLLQINDANLPNWIVDNGWPDPFLADGNGTAALGFLNSTAPRILLGV